MAYLYDVREFKFVLKEWLDMGKLLACPAYKDNYSMDDIDPIVDTTFRIARDVIAPINEDEGKIGVRFVDGKVITPESFKKAFQIINEAALGVQNADREMEGRLPYTLICTNYELIAGACLPFISYWGLANGAVSVIQQHGSEYHKSTFLPKMFSGQWGGTMCMTEAGAGSDVGATTSKAFATATPGIYKIKGNKTFITAGDHDLQDNIIHLVLARIEGARSGVTGLSLFIVPKFWVNDDGALGRFNDVVTTGIEEKMGWHGSPTCSLSFGENNECYGYLVGEGPDENGRAQGIAQMFVMMNEERLYVGIQALGLSSEACFQSRDYAKERVQGAKMTDPKAGAVRIIEHEDIRRMLMLQKSCTEAIRALIYKTAYYMDLSHDSADPEERAFAEGMFQISNPMCKAYSSDLAWPLINEAIQVYGGYGFMTEYPVEKLARDCKICSIWEGTNYIQALDLVGRKFTMSKGKVFANWINDISQFMQNNKEAAGFEQEFKILEDSFEDFQAIMKQLQKFGQDGNLQMMPLFATRILHAASMLYCARLILEQGLLADKKVKELGEQHFDANFYRGKIASARFYLKNVLPQLVMIRRLIEIGDATAIEMDEACLG